MISEIPTDALYAELESRSLNDDPIVRLVESVSGVPKGSIRSRSRKTGILEARYLAAYLLRHARRNFYQFTLTEIAQRLGRTDHTTVINALRQAEWMLEREQQPFTSWYKRCMETCMKPQTSTP